jgi:conjugative transfer region protein TrbK
MRRIGAVLIRRAARAGAFALLGAVILAVAIQFHHDTAKPDVSAPVGQKDDSLDATLERCRAIARPEDVDAVCLAAWAEVRRRFFAPHDASEVQP